MTPAEKQIEFRNKLLAGLDLAYKRLLEYKKYKKTELVVMQGDKIVRIKPEDMPQ